MRNEKRTHRLYFGITPVTVLLLVTLTSLSGSAADTLFIHEEVIFPEIVVTATRARENIANIPISTTVIPATVLEQLPAQNLGQLFIGQLGVAVRPSTMGGLSTVSLRGSRSNQTLVAIDGNPVNDPFNGSADLSRLPMENIDRIEIVRGPASHLFGANALGGIINFISRTHESPSTVSVAGGSNGLRRLAAAVLLPGGANLTASDYASDGTRQNSDFQRRTVTLARQYTGKPGTLRLNLMATQGETGVPGADPDGESEISSSYDRERDEDVYFTLSYASDPAKNWRLHILVKPEYHKTDYHFEVLDFATFEMLKARNVFQSHILSSFAKLEANLRSATAIIGVDVQNTQGHVGQTVEQDVNIRTVWTPAIENQALWGELIMKHGSITMIPAARIDRHSVYGMQPSYSAGAVYHTERLSIRASAATAFHAPGFNDLYWPGAGNLDLKPEISMAGELGIAWWLNPNQRIEIAIYNRDINDMIAWDPIGTEGIWSPRNINRVHLQGFEFAYQFGYRKLTAGFNYAHQAGYQWNTETTYDDFLSGVLTREIIERKAAFLPDNLAGLSLTFKHNAWQLGATASYRSTVVRYYPDYSLSPDVSMAIKELPARTLLNVRFGYQHQQIKPYLEIMNLLNTAYSEQFGNYIQDEDFPMPGRTLLAGVRLEL